MGVCDLRMKEGILYSVSVGLKYLPGYEATGSYDALFTATREITRSFLVYTPVNMLQL